MPLNFVRLNHASPERAALERILKEQFPKEEYFSLEDQLALQDRGEVEVNAIYEGKTLLGIMTLRLAQEMVYLFFLAIDRPYQGKGYGQESLRAIKERYPEKAIAVDFELVDHKAANSLQRQRRRKFYEKAGFSETGWGLSYRGVDYEIFCLNQPFRIAKFKALLDSLPIPGFHPQYFQL
jgi:GNAT superfamily N-acetyltransferase